ncbi:MAG: helix-turn-helix domain-containing protein [Candidatus Limnocylindria bacterium]
MREPYPLTLVPLLPQFLQRRRAKSDFPLRAMERLGLDRPAYFFAMDLGIQDPGGALPRDIGNGAYRTTDAQLRTMAAAGESVGLLVWRDGRWSLTDDGKSALADLRQATAEHYASLSPIDAGELERLAGVLDTALAAVASSPDPQTREHTPRAARYRWTEPSSAMARLDAAIYGLWQVRDDCHMQAWRDAGLTGPALDVLTRVWRTEAATEDELTEKLGTQRPDDVRAAAQQLRADGLLTAGPALGLTPKGAATRERIETETDRYFFAPWPESVGAQADWVTERLAALNAALD